METSNINLHSVRSSCLMVNPDPRVTCKWDSRSSLTDAAGPPDKLWTQEMAKRTAWLQWCLLMVALGAMSLCRGFQHAQVWMKMLPFHPENGWLTSSITGQNRLGFQNVVNFDHPCTTVEIGKGSLVVLLCYWQVQHWGSSMHSTVTTMVDQSYLTKSKALTTEWDQGACCRLLEEIINWFNSHQCHHHVLFSSPPLQLLCYKSLP